MALFLQVFGAFCLAVLVLLLLILGVARSRLRRLAQTVEPLMVSPPARLRLRPVIDAPWTDVGQFEELYLTIIREGFEESGAFEAGEVEGFFLHGFVKPEDAVVATAYQHPVYGNWLELATYYKDGTSFTFTTLGIGAEQDQRPGHGRMHFPDVEPRELLRRFLAQRPRHRMRRVSALEYEEVVEAAYADEMDWRNSRGGTTTEEIRALAEAMGQEVSEDVVEAAREKHERDALLGLDQAITERFIHTTRMSVAEWEAVRDSLVCVHDRLTLEQASGLFYEYLGEEFEPGEPAEAASARQLFALLNEELPPEDRFRKLGTVDRPLPADVYAAPR